MFVADTFVFNGRSCDEFGLRLYSFESSTTNEFNAGAKIDILEDHIQKSIHPVFYGVDRKDKLEYEMTFGSEVPLDRYDIDLISSWLTECNGYHYLDILQEDMSTFRYWCIISDVKNIDIGNIPFAFKCTVTCDSQFAYMIPQKYKYCVASSANVTIFNKSNISIGCHPSVVITTNGSSEISFTNQSDNNKTTKFTSLPSSGATITIDGERQIITCPDIENIYENFNGSFLNLVRGVNKIVISGACIVEITAEYPMKVGGC